MQYDSFTKMPERVRNWHIPQVMSPDGINSRLQELLDSPTFAGLAGLVALSPDEELALNREFFTQCGDTQGLQRLLRLKPALSVVALSRAAMRAYETNFWENFGRELGIHIPSSVREQLTNLFCCAARTCIPGYQRARWQVWRHAGEFLAQAGLPLDRCSKFAHVFRKAVDDTGLPDSDDLAQVREVIERMLERKELQTQAIIRKALLGPAGPMLVQAATAAVQSNDFARCNVALGDALREAFESVPFRRASTQLLCRPFIRLATDLNGFELCAPYPPEAAIGAAGIIWVVNDQKFRVPHGESMVLPVDRFTPMSVTLQGLVDGRSLNWTLNPQLISSSDGFMIFESQRRRLIRGEESEKGIILPVGDYVLAHRPQWQCRSISERLELEDQRLALTIISLRPAQEIVFEDDDDHTFCVAANNNVWIEPEGKSFLTSENQIRVHFGWTKWPHFWIPEDSNMGDWHVELQTVSPGSYKLADTDMRAGGLRCCYIAQAADLCELPPGLHCLTIVIRHGPRVRQRQDFLLWVGLVQADARNFRWETSPQNLDFRSLSGFSQVSNGLDAVTTPERVRALTFTSPTHDPISLRWMCDGARLESLNLGDTVSLGWKAHRLGSTFAADHGCTTRLRLSVSPAKWAQLRVNGSVFKTVNSPSGQICFELSLASLAVLYRDGGRLTLHTADGSDVVFVAQFQPPVVAVLAKIIVSDQYKTLKVLLASQPKSVRLIVRNLLTQQRFVVDPSSKCASSAVPINPFAQLDSASYRHESASEQKIWFNGLGMPAILCQYLGADKIGERTGFALKLSVPNDKWKSGIWWTELECRISDCSEWTPLRGPKMGALPLICVRNLPTETSVYREVAMMFAFADRTQDGFRPSKLKSCEGNESEVVRCYTETRGLLKDKIDGQAWSQFENVETLRSLLRGQVNYLLDTQPAGIAPLVLHQINLDERSSIERSMLASIPAVLALSADLLSNLVDGDLLRTCLRWCSRIKMTESMADGFHRLELDPDPMLGHPCIAKADVVRHCKGGGFDFQGCFAGWNVEKLRLCAPASLTPLSGQHLHWAIRQVLIRRLGAEAVSSLSNVSTIFGKAAAIAAYIFGTACNKEQAHILPAALRTRPWPEVECNDSFIENLVAFASTYALAARLAGHGLLSFRSFRSWLRTQDWITDQAHAVSQTEITLICRAPEVLSFFLMFWQLIVQNQFKLSSR